MQVLFSAFTWEDLCVAEGVLIQQWGTLSPGGYNLTVGGEGRSGFRPSAESVERTAAWHRGRKRDPQAVARTAAAIRGCKRSEAHKAAISAARRGKPRSAETKAKLSAARRGVSVNAGERNHSAILSAEQVRAIRLRLQAGETTGSVGQSFGLGYKAIWKIKRGFTWGSVQ